MIENTELKTPQLFTVSQIAERWQCDSEKVTKIFANVPGVLDGRGLDEDVLDLASAAAGVHLERAADGAGNAAQEFQPRDAAVRRSARQCGIERRGASADARAFHGNLAERGRQADHHAGNAAVADQKIGTDADHADLGVKGSCGQERGEIVRIGATTHEEYRRAIAADPALDRRFRPIDIEEPSEEDSLAILTSQRERLENHHDVTIRPDAGDEPAQVVFHVRHRNRA